jgi:hypothetical protein
MHWYQIIVAWHVLIEAVLNLIGLLNIRACLRPRRQRTCIAFQAYAEHLAQCFAPVIDRLRKQAPDIELHFIVLPHPHFTFRSIIDLRTFVRNCFKIAAPNVRFFWQVIWQKYDVLICTDVYAKFPLRRTKKVLLKHGAGVASRILTRHPFRKTMFDFDLVLVSGEADRDLLRRFGTANFAAEKVIAAGLPYLDRLQTCAESREAYLRRMGILASKKVALIGPSWRGLQLIEAREPGYFDQVIAVLKEIDWQVLIKMHICSFNKAMAQGEDWAERLCRYAQSNIHIDYDVDDVPAFLYSDILITDISSRAFDFMLLDKPVITVFPDNLFTDDLDRERIRLLRQGAFFIHSAAELKSIITQRLNECDLLRTERQRLVRGLFANPGRATEVVVEHLLRQLQTGI